MATLRPNGAQLVNGLIPPAAVQIGQLVSLLRSPLGGFQLPAQLLHLLLRQRGLGLLLLCPCFLVAQLVPLLEKVLFPGFDGLLVRLKLLGNCLLYTSPSPRDRTRSRMPSSA